MATHYSELEQRLLNDYQRGLPPGPTPYATMATQLGVSEHTVLSTLKRLQDQGAVSRVGAVLKPNRVGASTLAAMAVPPARLEEVAALVSAFPEVNHNYEREHTLNLWFVATAPSRHHLHRVLDKIRSGSGLEVLDLPMLEDYFIDLGFDLQWK